MSRARSANTPWYTGPSCCPSRDGRRRRGSLQRPFRFPCNTSTGPTSTFRGFRRHGRVGSVSDRRRGGGRRLRPQLAGQAHRHHGRRPDARRRRAGGDAGAGGRGRRLARQLLVAPDAPAACRRPVPGAPRLVRRGARCPAAPTSCAPRPIRRSVTVTITAREASRRSEHARRKSGQVAQMNEVGVANLDADARSPSTPIAKIARPAPSSSSTASATPRSAAGMISTRCGARNITGRRFDVDRQGPARV
jgi:hypothetical protein